MIIKLLKRKDLWLVDRKKRRNASTAYQWVERKLLAQSRRSDKATLKEKTAVKVVYDQKLGYTNETEKSLDPRYLLRTLAQFLEDYSTPDWVKEKESQYAQR